ncbi:mitochondrial branched-chain alpha-ketoacid dehydrogenase kinase-domain-containing protein [Zopfochytrium polystomum]|nr:mitochondrial branched-chain alpha-ketoacid dehydrogenase kinase-domain-containing protein [Zopfochytrium polystomum]
MASKMSTAALLDRIPAIANLPQTAVSLRQMVEFGRTPSAATMLRATQFIHKELPVRLARRVVELENLPHGLSAVPSVVKVKNWYTQSFIELLQFPQPQDAGVPSSLLAEKLVVEGNHRTGFSKHTHSHIMTATSLTKTSNKSPPVKTTRRYYNPIKEDLVPSSVPSYNDKFVKMIENIKRRHDPVATTLAQGIIELKDTWRKTNNPLLRFPNGANAGPSKLLPVEVQSFLDRFYMSRIGIRMLIGQHVALAKSATNPSATPEEYVGIICTKTSVRRVAMEAADNARQVCQDTYGLFAGSGPDIRLVFAPEAGDVEFMYVPSHLHHMLFELFKNSLRAVVERHGVDADAYPEIRVVVAAGKEDITIKISDEGGGIPRSGMPLIWTYMYTTAEKPELEDDYNRSDFRAPMAGFGYGLPLSRLYARYFGGDLRLISMEGYGTDAYLHLSRLSNSEEPLPS